MAFSFGNVFGGLTTGIEKGLQYDASFLKSFVWCIKTNNKTALDELIVIAETNIHETVDAAGNVLPNVIGGLIAGNDPFSNSRHAFQAWQVKYGKH